MASRGDSDTLIRDVDRDRSVRDITDEIFPRLAVSDANLK